MRSVWDVSACAALLVGCTTAAPEPRPAPAAAPEESPAAPPTAPAPAPVEEPETFTEFRYQATYSMNRHGPMPHGASNTRRESQVELSLGSRRTIRVVDTGRFREGVLSKEWYTETVRAWRRAWAGTWRAEGDRVMLVTLAPQAEGRECEETKTTRGYAPETKPCDPDPDEVRLRCELGEVALAGAETEAGPGAEKKTSAWTCRHEADPHPPGTPLAWVFGTKQCLRAQGRRRSPYAPCEGTLPTAEEP